LEKAFGAFGRVQSVHIPLAVTGKSRGFAFVQFGSQSEATAAIAGLNGQKIQGRAVAVDWSLNKTDYQKRVNEAKAATPTTATTPTVKKEDLPSVKVEDDTTDSNGSIKKEKDDQVKEEKKVKVKKEDMADIAATEYDEGSDNEEFPSIDSDDDHEGDDDEAPIGVDESADGETPASIDDDESGDDDEEDGKKKKDDDEEKPEREKSKDVGRGLSVFIRNLSYDTTEEQVITIIINDTHVPMINIHCYV
jgi:nucleolar protein 4